MKASKLKSLRWFLLKSWGQSSFPLKVCFRLIQYPLQIDFTVLCEVTKKVFKCSFGRIEANCYWGRDTKQCYTGKYLFAM